MLFTATCRYGGEKMETDEATIAETSEAKVKEGGVYGQQRWPLGISNPSA